MCSVGLIAFHVLSVFRGFFEMSSFLQTLIVAGIALLAVAYLLWTWFGPKKKPGCGSAGDCGAISPEVKKLQARLKH